MHDFVRSPGALRFCRASSYPVHLGRSDAAKRIDATDSLSLLAPVSTFLRPQPRCSTPAAPGFLRLARRLRSAALSLRRAGLSDPRFEVSGGWHRSYFVPTFMLHQPPVLLAFVSSQATFDFLGRDKSAATCLQRDLPAGKKQHR